MYGTREAAAAWQAKVTEVMVGAGFHKSVINPCIFVHNDKFIESMIHGDDFISAGEEPDLNRFNKVLEAVFEIKNTLIWPRIG